MTAPVEPSGAEWAADKIIVRDSSGRFFFISTRRRVARMIKEFVRRKIGKKWRHRISRFDSTRLHALTSGAGGVGARPASTTAVTDTQLSAGSALNESLSQRCGPESNRSCLRISLTLFFVYFVVVVITNEH